MSSPFISKVSKLNLSPDSRKGTPPKLRHQKSGTTEKTEDEDPSLPTTPTPKGKSAPRQQSEQRDSPVPAPKEAALQPSASASGSRAQSRVGEAEPEQEPEPEAETQEEGQQEQQGEQEEGGAEVEEEEEDGQDQEQPTPSLNGGPTESHPERLDLSILKGLEVGEDGLIHDQDGNAVGRLVEGKPEDLKKKVSMSRLMVSSIRRPILSTRPLILRLLPPWVSSWRASPRSWLVRSPTSRARSSGTTGMSSVAWMPTRPPKSRKFRALRRQEPKPLALRPTRPPKTPEEAPEEGKEEKELPPLSILEGLRCNKLGKIIDPATGKPVGELIEGDAKKLASLGVTLDDQGQFWDNRGNVIGRAQTLAPEEYPDEPPFGGLEGLHVVEDGWVEDQNGKRVGKIVEGDAKKVLGRPVDEDGDVTDKHGNVIAKAEYYEAPEEEPEAEPEAIDLSSLEGLTPNKLGYVIGPKGGVPIGRVVEGNPKELAGKEIHDGLIYDGPKPIGRVELIPENEREKKPEGPFAGLEGLVVNKDGFVEDEEGNIVGKVTEGDIKNLRGRTVDEDGDIVDKFGSVKGHAEPYEVPEEEKPEEVDLSILEGKIVNKAGNVVDGSGKVYGRVVSGGKGLAGRKVDKKGQIWGDNGQVIGQAELVPGAEEQKAEGPFFGFENAVVGKDGVVTDGTDRIIGRVIEGDAKKLQGRKVDEDGDILDKNGNPIGKAERWEPEEKKRNINPMAGRKVNKEGEVRDADGNLIGKLTSGDLPSLIGKEIDDNGYVVDNDGNKIGECTLIENIPEPEPEPEAEPEPEPEPEEPGPSQEELDAKKKEEEDRQLAKKMSAIVGSTLDRLRPICKMISEHVDRADRTPKEELDEEQLVKDVKPLLEEGGHILQECNGAIRALDPDGHIAAAAKARAASHEASPEEYALADQLKELTETVLRTIENGKKRIAGMPHAKKELNPLWGLLSEPLFQIIAAVGLLLSGVLGLVGRLLDGLGLGGLVRGLLGGLGLDKLLGNLGLTSLTDALGLTGRKKK
ncbi:LEA domain protein [Aspergillus saccharolyticus JOP 1030-1]|uniref:DUF6987 domain-containing protein n=1 Tax=Aspergillus saccharolyticus JOP 1030-1 TaxID=1450539 RepID=A0A318Z8Y0_9EURO|nr:hypothetical protein BP01DRAFT_324489 [Aspergillus saccharolyticus JOP 1030-1]PYH42844.1 hypothetical protein BP01DRAFT_324489 [Aspergillus saccharolyticus JOP 1030-1]